MAHSLNGKSLKAQLITGYDQFARRFVNWVPSGRRIGTGLFNVVIGIFESRLIAEINSCLYIIHLHHLYNLGLKFFAAIQCKHRMFAICFCYTLFFNLALLFTNTFDFWIGTLLWQALANKQTYFFIFNEEKSFQSNWLGILVYCD